MSEITLTLPDGSKRPFKARASPAPSWPSASPSRWPRRPWRWSLDGLLTDLADPIDADAAVKIVTRTDPEALELIRHDAAHVMAEAVQALWPGTQVTIGPVIENGFFYDFAKEEPFHPDDLATHRSQDARDHRSQRALHQGGVEPRPGQGLLPREGRAVQGRAGRRDPRGRGPEDLQAGRVARPVPRPAHDLDRPDRQGLQAHQVRRLLLARRRARTRSCSASTAPPGPPRRSSPPT